MFFSIITFHQNSYGASQLNGYKVSKINDDRHYSYFLAHILILLPEHKIMLSVKKGRSFKTLLLFWLKVIMLTNMEIPN